MSPFPNVDGILINKVHFGNNPSRMFDNKLPNFVDKTSTCLNILFNIELYFF